MSDLVSASKRWKKMSKPNRRKCLQKVSKKLYEVISKTDSQAVNVRLQAAIKYIEYALKHNA